jgi:hypothetical protein
LNTTTFFEDASYPERGESSVDTDSLSGKQNLEADNEGDEIEFEQSHSGKKVLSASTTSQTSKEGNRSPKSVVKEGLDKSVKLAAKKVKQVNFTKIIDIKDTGKAHISKTTVEEERSNKSAHPVKLTQLQRITFQIKFHTKPGQSMAVVGDHSFLGDNDAGKAFQLRYLNTEFWVGTLDIPDTEVSQAISYKYLLNDEGGSVTMEWGDDR